MDIPFSSRSKFLAACEGAVTAHRADLDAGRTVSVTLGDGGFEKRVLVTLNRDERDTFGSDWTGSDVTWFPVRIRAAATALRDCGCVGTFEVSHEDGTLSIRAT